MTPPVQTKVDPTIDNESCPPEIKAHPLPFDKCYGPPPQAPQPKFVAPKDRFERLSLPAEAMFRFSPERAGFLFGTGAVYHPIYQLGLGSMLTTNFTDEISVLGRVETSFSLQQHGKVKGTIGAMAGLTSYFRQPHGVEELNFGPQIDGNFFTWGLDTSFDIRLTSNFPLLSFSPFLRIMRTEGGPATMSVDPDQTLTATPTMDFSLGLRLNLNLVPNYE